MGVRPGAHTALRRPVPHCAAMYCSMMFIDFNEFTLNTAEVVKQVLVFVGADPQLLHFTELPPGMQVRADVREGGECGGEGKPWRPQRQGTRRGLRRGRVHLPCMPAFPGEPPRC